MHISATLNGPNYIVAQRRQIRRLSLGATGFVLSGPRQTEICYVMTDNTERFVIDKLRPKQHMLKCIYGVRVGPLCIDTCL